MSVPPLLTQVPLARHGSMIPPCRDHGKRSSGWPLFSFDTSPLPPDETFSEPSLACSHLFLSFPAGERDCFGALRSYYSLPAASGLEHETFLMLFLADGLSYP